MTVTGPIVFRYAIGLAMSVAFNLGLIVTLAELGQPQSTEDAHDAHGVAPSVVEPPPPITPTTPAAAQPTPATALPASPPAPNLDLPAPAELSDGPALQWGGLDNLGLQGLDTLSSRAGLEPVTEGPEEPPQLAVPPDLTRFYPQAARRRKLGGRTIVALAIDAKGRVVEVNVLRSEPPGLFERAAERAARTFRFTPAQREGRAVAARTRLELKWQLPR